MKKNKILKIITIFLIISIISIGALNYSQFAQSKEYEDATYSVDQADRPNMELETYFKQPLNRDEEKQTDTQQINLDNIKITQEERDIIEKLDNKNAEKNINNYKKLLAELNVPNEYRKEIIRLLKKEYQTEDIFIAYEFLYDNYGKVYEIETLLLEKNSGKDWTTIFNEYKKKNKEFIPSDFSKEYLENMLSHQNITIDDIMIADRIANMNWQNLSNKKIKFDSKLLNDIKELNSEDTIELLLDMRKKGVSWGEIKIGLGILNTEENIKSISIDNNKLSYYMENTDLSKDMIIEGLVLAEKKGINESEVMMNLESGLSKDEIYKKHLVKKFSE